MYTFNSVNFYSSFIWKKTDKPIVAVDPAEIDDSLVVNEPVVDPEYSFMEMIEDANDDSEHDRRGMEIVVPLEPVKESVEWLARAKSLFSMPGQSDKQKVKILTLAPHLGLYAKYKNISSALSIWLENQRNW